MAPRWSKTSVSYVKKKDKIVIYIENIEIYRIVTQDISIEK